jgi:hypothetical protein
MAPGGTAQGGYGGASSTADPRHEAINRDIFMIPTVFERIFLYRT